MLARAVMICPPGKYLLDCYMGRCIREDVSHTITARTATDNNTWVMIVSERERERLVKTLLYDDYNSNIPKNQRIIGTVTTHWGHNALRAGWKLIEIYESKNDE